MSGINWVKGSQKNGFDLGDSGCFNLQTNFFSFENSKVSSFFDIIILGGGGGRGEGVYGCGREYFHFGDYNS